MKCASVGLNNRLICRRIIEFAGKSTEEKKKKKEEKLIEPKRDLWDTIKHPMQIMRVPERDKGDQEAQGSFEEVMTRDILSLMKNINLQIQEAQQTQIGKTQIDEHLDTSQSNCQKTATKGES